MIYTFSVTSDESKDFLREIEIDSEALFIELNDAILDSVGYSKDSLTSFWICDEYWEMQNEVVMSADMHMRSDEDVYTMADTRLNELVKEKGDSVLFVYDTLNERSFFMKLKGIKKGFLDAPKCVTSVAKAPKQLDMFDNLADIESVMNDLNKSSKSNDDDYGSSFLDDFEGNYNDDEIEGLSTYEGDEYFDVR